MKVVSIPQIFRTPNVEDYGHVWGRFQRLLAALKMTASLRPEFKLILS